MKNTFTYCKRIVIGLLFGLGYISLAPLVQAESYSVYSIVSATANSPRITYVTPGGMAGDQVTISGEHLAAVTGVSFNGMPAEAFVVDSKGFSIRVKVPRGATSGPITLQTTAGIIKTDISFNVITKTITDAELQAILATDKESGPMVPVNKSKPVNLAAPTNSITNVTSTTGDISGVKFEDTNRNGTRDVQTTSGAPVIIFVVDASGSTTSTFQGTTIGNLNTDGLSNTIIDAELAVIDKIRLELLNKGAVNAEIGIVAFESTASTVDLNFASAGIQFLTKPAADLNSNTKPDIVESFTNPTGTGNPFFPNGNTNYELALRQVITQVNLIPTSREVKIIFMSDGTPNPTSQVYTDEVAVLKSKSNVSISAIGIGDASLLPRLRQIDPNARQVTNFDNLIDFSLDVITPLEAGLAGVTLYLDLNNDGTRQGNEPAQVSATNNPNTNADETGAFTFSNLAPGTYIVRELVPAGYMQVTPESKAYTVTVIAGQTVSNINFGNLADSEDPKLVGVPANVTVACLADVLPAPTVTATDNLDTNPKVTFAENSVPGNCPNSVTVTRTWTATDEALNSITATQVITVLDNITPTFNGLPTASIVVSAPADACQAEVALSQITATDNCGTDAVPVKYTIGGVEIAAGYKFNLGNSEVTVSATDVCGNLATATFTVTVEDQTPPVPSIADLPVLKEECSLTVTTKPTATDNCGSTLEVTTTDPLEYTSQGTYTITWTYTDAAGNSSNQTQTVEIKDVTDPTFATFPDNITVDAQAGVCGAEVSFTLPTFTDNCAGATLNRTDGSSLNTGDVFPVGTSTLTYQLTDAGGNLVTKSLVITVTDKQAPVITPPVTISQANDAGKCGAQLTLTNPAAQDNCGIESITNDAADFFPVGTTTVKWTVTDIHGNTSDVSQEVTITDTEEPKALAQNLTIQLGSSGTATISAEQVNNNSSDNCGIKSISINKTEFSCQEVGTNTVTLTVTDIHGNTATAEATITVEDKTAPTALAKNMAVYLDASGNASVTPEQVDNGSSDACSTVQLALNKTNFTCNSVGTNTVTLTVTDQAGNEATATAIVTVMDNINPIAQTKNITVSLTASGQVIIAATDVDNNSSDNCGIKSLTLNKTTFSCLNIGANTVTLTVTDNSGNVSTEEATVTVNGTIPAPVITVTPTSNVYTGGNASIIYLGYGGQGVQLQASGGVSYKWSPANGLSNANSANPVFTPTGAGSYTFMVTAKNSAGCEATASVTIKVLDIRCGNKNDKVLVCHNGNTLCVDATAIPAHLAHGDKLGNCSSGTTLARVNSQSSPTATEAAKQAILTIAPNPFSTRTTLNFNFDEDEEYTIAVYDLKGALVKQLPSGKAKAKELKQVEWKAANVPVGVYIVRLTSNSGVQHLRLVRE